MKLPALLALVPCLLVSCGSDGGKKESAASEAPVRKKMSERWGGPSGQADPEGFQRDKEGKFVIKNPKRSPYENVGQDPNFSGRSVAKQEYKAGDFARKSFWGSKEYDRKAYAGNTDGSRFSKASKEQGQGAREAGSAADETGSYDTGRYATGDAREAGTREVARTTNDGIENRRESFEQPEVIGWQEQRRMSKEQLKGFLGR